MLDNRWLGSYLIREAQLELGTYLFSQFDKAQLNGVYIRDWLIRFYQREGCELDAAEDAVDNRLEKEVKEETEQETDN